MKLKESTIQSVVIGSQKAKQFRVSDNKVIYDILRNKLYEKPINAICREIASNSRDANRESGKPNTPIVIEVVENSQDIGISGDLAIAFHDEGPGITPDRMDDVFLAYGESTKRDTNEQTGGYGLGAKTPFAYSDTFSVKTVCDVDGKRMKFFYVAAIDKEEKGTMYLFREEPTEDPTGTTITVPIKPSDRDKFEVASIVYTSTWDVLPTYKNFKRNTTKFMTRVYGAMSENATGDREMFPDFEVWLFDQGKTNLFHSQGFTGPIILVDGVPYPFPTEFLHRQDVTVPMWATIVVPFGNGELDLSGSRETVQATDANYKLIKNRISGIKQYALKWLQDYIDLLPNIYRAAYAFHTFKKQSSEPAEKLKIAVLFHMVGGSSLKRMYKGKEVKFDVYNPSSYSLFVNTLDRFNGSRKKNMGHEAYDFFEAYNSITSLTKHNVPTVYLLDPSDKKPVQRVCTVLKRDKAFICKKPVDPYFYYNHESYKIWRGKGAVPHFNALTLQQAIDNGEIDMKVYEAMKKELEDKAAFEEGLLNEFYRTKNLIDEEPTSYTVKQEYTKKIKQTVLVRYRKYEPNDRSSLISYTDYADEVDASKPVFQNCIVFEADSVSENRSSKVDTHLVAAMLLCTVGTKHKVIAASMNYKIIIKMGAKTPQEYIASLTDADFKRIRKVLLWKRMDQSLVDFLMIDEQTSIHKDFALDEQDKKILEIIKTGENGSQPVDIIRRQLFEGYQNIAPILLSPSVAKHFGPIAEKYTEPTKEELEQLEMLPAKYPMLQLLSYVTEDDKDSVTKFATMDDKMRKLLSQYMTDMQKLKAKTE